MTQKDGMASKNPINIIEGRDHYKLTMMLPLFSFIAGPVIGYFGFCCLAVWFPAWLPIEDITHLFTASTGIVFIGLAYDFLFEAPVALTTCFCLLILGVSGLHTKSFRVQKCLVCIAYFTMATLMFLTFYLKDVFPIGHSIVYYYSIFPIIYIGLTLLICFTVFVVTAIRL